MHVYLCVKCALQMIYKLIANYAINKCFTLLLSVVCLSFFLSLRFQYLSLVRFCLFRMEMSN